MIYPKDGWGGLFAFLALHIVSHCLALQAADIVGRTGWDFRWTSVDRERRGNQGDFT